ncbi:MAG: HPr-rel-A system PqqD family peptide chaperone [Magnetococcales bacterium]|nr:HPr-rel-A system PqqD family peptide chaperone [Magnetococcales bacterium]
MSSAPFPLKNAAIPVPRRWVGGDASTWIHARFGADHLLFDRRSGATHRVNDLVIDILHALAREPGDALELARRLQLDPEEKTVLGDLERIIEDLDRLGLLAPVER